jgi:hypothetical protein
LPLDGELDGREAKGAGKNGRRWRTVQMQRRRREVEGEVDVRARGVSDSKREEGKRAGAGRWA